MSGDADIESAAAGAREAGMRRAGELIRDAVTSWPGVEVAPHRFGGTEYRYGRKEMGDVHGDRLADLPLPRKLHDEVIADGRARPHHVLPHTGWVSYWMDGPGDAAGAIELFRIQYERYSRPRATPDARRILHRGGAESLSESPGPASRLGSSDR